MNHSFFKTFLLTSIALSPVLLSNCTSVRPALEPQKIVLTPRQKNQNKIEKLAQSLSPEHIYKIPLLQRGMNMLLDSPEGCEVLSAANPALRIQLHAQDVITFAGLTDGKTIILPESDIVSDNPVGIALKTAHEIEHTNTPALPTHLLNNNSAYNLSLNQLLTLYKLNEINSLLTEMQICVDLNYPTDNLPDCFKAYALTYQTSYKEATQMTASQKKQREIAVYRTKAAFFQLYLDPVEIQKIDPEFNEIYEKRALDFVVENNLHLSPTDVSSPQYDKCLNHYRKKCGPYITLEQLNASHIDTNNAYYFSVSEAVSMDAFFQKYHPEYGYTVRDILTGLNTERKVQTQPVNTVQNGTQHVRG